MKFRTIRRRRFIDRDVRNAIYQRDRFCCVYCDRSLRDIPIYEWTLDHLWPFCLGWPSTPTNLVTACRPCNNARNRTPFFEFATLDAQDRIFRSVASPIEPYLPQLPRPARKR